MRGENIFGVKIVNAGTCGVNADSQAKRLDDSGEKEERRAGQVGGSEGLKGLTVIRPNERRSELAVAGTCVEKAVERTSVRIGACALRAQELRVETPRGKCPSSQMPKAKEAPSPRCLP